MEGNMFFIFRLIFIILLCIWVLVMLIGSVFFIWCIIKHIKKMEDGFEENGIETIATVKSSDYSIKHCRYDTFVKYIGTDNKEHIKKLNSSALFPVGAKIKIKYLPTISGMAKFCGFIED